MDKIHQILITKNRSAEVPAATKSIHKFFTPDLYEYKLWDNDAIRTLIRDNFEDRVLKAYDKLRPYAYKADLARYCILYVYGGWYIDINIEIVSSPPNESNYDLILIRDYNNGTRVAPWQLANGMIYAKPRHEVFMVAINKVVSHCKSNYYGKRTLSVTGPEVFGRAVAEWGWDNGRNEYLVGDFIDNVKLKRKIFTLNGSTFALHKQLNGGIVGVDGTNDYVTMWHKQDVYNK